MSVLEVPAEAEERIAAAIRQNISEVIATRGIDAVATDLGLHPRGLETLLWSSRWTLSVALRVAVVLGLPDGKRMEEAVAACSIYAEIASSDTPDRHGDASNTYGLQ